MIQECRPRLYLLWTVLTGLFFGACALLLYLGLSVSILISSHLIIKIAVGFVLLVLVLATISAPYTYVACQVSKDGLLLPEHTQGYSPTGTDDLVGVLLILPIVILNATFLPQRYFKLTWDSIQQASIQKSWWGEVLILEVAEEKGIKRHTITWPLADTPGFQSAVFNWAPKDHPLSERMQILNKTIGIRNKK